MKPKPKKSYLKSYSPGVKVVGGAIVATTIIVGGYLVYQALKPQTQTSTTNTVTSSQTTETKKAANYNGRYIGNSTVANGISSANVVISGSNLTGTAVYSGVFNSKINLNVTGTVDSNGKLSGNFSGSNTIAGRIVTVKGTYTGNIINTSMNVSYSATASGSGLNQTYPGSITLSKQ